MLRNLRLVAGSMLFASVAMLVAQGAELRTTAARRPIHRTVSFQEASFEEAAEYTEMIDSVVQSDVLVESCPSCGVAGCDMGCVIPCDRWVSFEYLLWWRKGQNFPALITTSPTGTAQADAGVLPGATVLFGNETTGEEARPGGRLSLGAWLNDCRTCGVEGRFYALSEEQITYAADSTTFPILARPFRDPVAMTNEATLLAFPGFTGPGNVNITSNSNVLGGDFLYRWQACQTPTTKLDLVAGYQFTRIDEDFNINSFTSAINVPGIDAGTTFTTSEQFYARNEYHAGQIGLAAQYVNCNWKVDMLAKLAFGNMREVVTIGGQTTIVTPGPGATTNTTPGPLAGAANSGRHEFDEFAVSPELGINCRYAITECLDLSFGYSFIYWSSVAQAGKQIDALLNDPPPAFALDAGSYWVHGLNVGANFRF
ncbi:MAG: BBP7 family outer membrane beta-barrel protein [Planctomycetaceae bacterium]|nr:BBP7 family outer membrane beta-barrel protein [Planctomycetales bacterium]MCB9923284.1 BBP7 family outer membrane beta-barrel protein [Planctomycetaceae bacterium]